MAQTRWPAARVAFAAFLTGKGYPASRIAADPQIKSQPAVVLRRMRMVGLVPKECEEHEALLAVPSATLEGLRLGARRRRQTPDELATELLGILAADPSLLANVLDDEPAEQLAA